MSGGHAGQHHDCAWFPFALHMIWYAAEMAPLGLLLAFA
jgi:hypothetical protein